MRKEVYLSIFAVRNQVRVLMGDAIVKLRKIAAPWNKQFGSVSNQVRSRRKERTNTNEASNTVDPYCYRFIVDWVLDGQIFRDIFTDEYTDC